MRDFLQSKLPCEGLSTFAMVTTNNFLANKFRGMPECEEEEGIGWQNLRGLWRLYLGLPLGAWLGVYRLLVFMN